MANNGGLQGWNSKMCWLFLTFKGETHYFTDLPPEMDMIFSDFLQRNICSKQTRLTGKKDEDHTFLEIKLKEFQDSSIIFKDTQCPNPRIFYSQKKTFPVFKDREVNSGQMTGWTQTKHSHKGWINKKGASTYSSHHPSPLWMWDF